MIFVVGGGGGISGNRAVLVARVPSGSTVTATKGGITLTPTMWVSETYPDQDIALFVFSSSQFDSVNPWTITATDGTNTESTTVLITTNKEYEVELKYPLVLFENGTISPVVGTFDTFANASVGTTIKCTENFSSGAGFTTQGSINLADYSELIFEFTGYTKNASYPLIIGVTSTKITSGSYSSNNSKFSVRHDPNAGDTTAIIDISSANSGYIAGCGVGTIEISKIYLQ